MAIRNWKYAIIFGVASVAALSTRSHADEIKLISVNAVKEVVEDRVRAFEKATGHKVTILWGGTESVSKRVTDGEIVDVVILGASTIDWMIGDRKIAAGSRSDFVKTGIGVAVRPGIPKPDISTSDNLKKAVLEAKSISFTTGASGVYLVELFKRLGISEQIKDKIVQPASGAAVSVVLERGEAELGFQQISELLHAKGIQYLGPLPPEIQNVTTYSVSLHAAAPSPDAARSLMKFLTSPDSAPIIRSQGMEPG
jgi:molybdate transport system substrate-binding protein